MNYLDTYALMELMQGNPHYQPIINEPFMVCDVTLAEFYVTVLRDHGISTAQQYIQRFLPFQEASSLEILIKGVSFRQEKKKSNISFFDAVGYQHAVHNKGIFVTGDSAFKELPSVKFIK